MTHGSTKCSCRWSTYSIMRPLREPVTQMKSKIDSCWAYSQRPTPPAFGQTGTPNFGVLGVFAKAHAAGVRADGHAELRGKEQHRNDLVHTAQPARVDLAARDRLGLEQLLEHHAILAVLARGDADAEGGKGPGDRRVAEDVIGAGRLLDPQGAARRQRLHPFDRLGDVPALVCVDH